MGKNRKRFRRVTIGNIHQFPKPPSSSDIPPIEYHDTIIECKKNIYTDYIACARNIAAVNAYRQKYEIVVGGSVPAPDPIESFDVMKEIPYMSLLKSYGRPSPIMLSQALPIILSGHDMIGLTKSGPERTLAYIIPAILHIHKQKKIPPNEGPIVLILTQSFEVGEKILQIASLFGTGIRMALFSNGSSPRFVRKNIEPGIEMIIACTESAKTLLSLNKMNLKFCSMVIFDDVDAQIISNGGQIFSNILKYAPAERQLLVFGQVWWADAEIIVSEHMPNGYCTVDVGKFHRDVHRICRQQVYILKNPEDRMQYTLNLIRKIQSSTFGKILIFVKCKEDSDNLANYLKTVGTMFTAISLNENGTSEEVQERIQSFRNGNINCLITTDTSVNAWMSDGIEHIIHFAYNKSNYGRRLSHMSYSSTGGTSHVILYTTERAVAKSVIENLKYGNQEISAKLLELQQEIGSTEYVEAKEDNQVPTIEISDDESDPKTLKVIPKEQNKFDSNYAGSKKIESNTANDSYFNRIVNNNAKDSYSRNDNQSIKPNSSVSGVKKRSQLSKDLMPLIPDAKKQKPESSTTDKWSGADVILERILTEEESMKKVLSLNEETPPVHCTNTISTNFASNFVNLISTNSTPTMAYSSPFSSSNVQSTNLPFPLSSTNSHLDGISHPQMSRSNDIEISPWKRRDNNISTVQQTEFMNYGNLLNERFFAGNNMNSGDNQMIYQRRLNQ